MKRNTMVVPLALLCLVMFLSCEKQEFPTALKNEGASSRKGLSLQSSVPDILVTTTSDVADFGGTQQIGDLPGSDGLVSLREAIIAANNTTGPQAIGFNIPASDPGFDGTVFTIKPTSRLPNLTGGGTSINGATQSDYSGDTNPVGPEIELDGSLTSALGEIDGLDLVSEQNHIHGLVVNNFFSGIGVGGSAATHNTITGCFIGTDPTGSFAKTPLFSSRFFGIGTRNGPSRLQIGGPSPQDRNVISGYTDCIFLSTANEVRIENNFIGTNASGTSAIGGGNGIVVDWSSHDLEIINNLVSGNPDWGIRMESGERVVFRGNKIGTDVTGRQAIANKVGIAIGTREGEPLVREVTITDNLISGNVIKGISLNKVSNVSIWGNRIGTDGDGNLMPDNHQWMGIAITDCCQPSPSFTNSDIAIGGESTGQGNLISGNEMVGISVSSHVSNATIIGNTISYNGTSGGIGIEAFPNAGLIIRGNTISHNRGNSISMLGSGTGYTITRNRIHSNDWLGIDLILDATYGAGVTPNDAGDLDTGPNNFMNFPVLTSAHAPPGQLVVKGTIDTPNPETVTLEFFANPVPTPGGDPSGYGEGAVFLGTGKANRQGMFTATLPPVAPGTLISATATDAAGNTSEFAANVEAKKPGE